MQLRMPPGGGSRKGGFRMTIAQERAFALADALAADAQLKLWQARQFPTEGILEDAEIAGQRLASVVWLIQRLRRGL